MTTQAIESNNSMPQNEQWVKILGAEISHVLGKPSARARQRKYLWPWQSGDRQVIHDALKQLLLLSCELPLFSKVNDRYLENYYFSTSEITVLFQKLTREQGENAWPAFIDTYVKWFSRKGAPQFYYQSMPQRDFPEWSMAFYSLMHALLFPCGNNNKVLSWFIDTCLTFNCMDQPMGLELDGVMPKVEKNRTYKVSKLPANVSLAIGSGNTQNLIEQIDYIGNDRQLMQRILQELLNQARYDTFEEIVKHFEVPFSKENRLEFEYMRWRNFWKGEECHSAIESIDRLELSNPLVHFLNQETDAFFCNATLYILHVNNALSLKILQYVLNRQSRPYQVRIPGLKPLFLAGYMDELIEELPESVRNKAYKQLLYHFSPSIFTLAHSIRKDSSAGNSFFSSLLVSSRI